MIDETILHTALEAAQAAGAVYAEARGVASREAQVTARDGAVETLRTTTDEGWGIRVAVTSDQGTGWGFAATARRDQDSAAVTARQAVEIAHASARVQHQPMPLEQFSAEKGAYMTTIWHDPVTVSAEEQIALAVMATEHMRAASTRVVATTAMLQNWHTHKHLINTLGADLEQTMIEVAYRIEALAQDESGYTYRRSMDNMQQAGWEYIEQAQLLDEADRVGDEAGTLVAAPWVDDGPQTVVLGDDIVALIVHESCGHPTELDRVLGWEAAFAGTSFLMPEMRGSLRYGAPQVTLVADATTPGGLGTFGWDDEGTPAQRWDLVRDGIFVDYLTDRASASAIGQQSRGCGRASGWDRMPIVRMVNVSLAPGHGTLDDLISTVERGIYINTPSSWSLDDKRMNFHFSTELCREIHHGKLGEYRKGAAFQARTPVFWGNCQAVGGPESWKLHGFPSCAKGEPLQLAHVAHGAAPMLVSELAIERK